MSLSIFGETRKHDDKDSDNFRRWINTYNDALEKSENHEILLNIGKEMYGWLNDGQYVLETAIEEADNPFIIEFQIPKRSSEVQKAFIEVPWELLADSKGYLAHDSALKFSPVRRS